MSTKDLLLDHDADGIQEYDNPPPAWIVWLFNLSIVFAIGYCIVYPSTWFWNGTMGWSQTGQYDHQMAAAKEHYGEPKAAQSVDIEAIVKDPGALLSGQEIYKVRCAPCHGDKGEGRVGPSMQDDEWLYGDTPQDIATSVTDGRPNGMPPWGKVLTPTEVGQVTAFVLSLKGGH